MAKVVQVCRAVSEVTGVPFRTIRYASRRMCQEGLLPSGPRGRNAPDFDPKHVGLIILAAMTAYDGFSGGVARVSRYVRELRDMEVCGGTTGDGKSLHDDSTLGNLITHYVGNATRGSAPVTIVRKKDEVCAAVGLSPDGTAKKAAWYATHGKPPGFKNPAVIMEITINGRQFEQIRELLEVEDG